MKELELAQRAFADFICAVVAVVGEKGEDLLMFRYYTDPLGDDPKWIYMRTTESSINAWIMIAEAVTKGGEYIPEWFVYKYIGAKTKAYKATEEQRAMAKRLKEGNVDKWAVDGKLKSRSDAVCLQLYGSRPVLTEFLRTELIQQRKLPPMREPVEPTTDSSPVPVLDREWLASRRRWAARAKRRQRAARAARDVHMIADGARPLDHRSPQLENASRCKAERIIIALRHIEKDARRGLAPFVKLPRKFSGTDWALRGLADADPTIVTPSRAKNEKCHKRIKNSFSINDQNMILHLFGKF